MSTQLFLVPQITDGRGIRRLSTPVHGLHVVMLDGAEGVALVAADPQPSGPHDRMISTA
jgi:hypothetical protein